MKYYIVTDDLRSELNRYLNTEYLKPSDVGREMFHLENFETISRVSPEKAQLLLATLFPEEVKEPNYLYAHKDEIAGLSKRLHVERQHPHEVSWTDFLIRHEGRLPILEGKGDLDILRHRIIRFG